MMVANSFDLWQKDAFFSAAEEVQESADIMESAYRLWIREKREGRAQEDLDELFKELQAALGTAKWQLEEFERAVRMSHGPCRDDTASTRHSQFESAIKNQISRVEAALSESFSEDGNQPLRWVNLNKEECDDLAMFLSGASQTPERISSESIKLRPFVKSYLAKDSYGRNEADNSNGDSSDFVIDIEDDGSGDQRAVGARRACSTPNFGALRILIPGEKEEEEKNAVVKGIEATPKEKGSKPLFWMQRCREYPCANRTINLFNQLLGRVGGFQRQLQSPIRLPFNRSIQLTIALMLMIFLILPFVAYSA